MPKAKKEAVAEPKEKKSVPMFKKYRVKVDFQNQFAAGIPEDPNRLVDFLDAKKPTKEPEDAIPLEDLAEMIEGQTLPSEEGSDEAAMTTTFKVDEDGNLAYESRCVKAHLKDCAFILSKNYLEKRGLKTAVANRIQVGPEMLPLSRNGGFLKDVDDKEIRPITVQTRQGPRTAVKIVKFVNAPHMEFELTVLNDGVVDGQLLETLFQYGGMMKGMGQDRNMGWGRYTFEIEELE